MKIMYELIRAKRKTVGIKVKDGKVTVRAPRGISQKEIDKIVDQHSAWIERKLSETRTDSKKELTQEEEKYLCSLAERVIVPRVAYYSEITGLYPEKVRISRAVGRFGSCSSKGRIAVSFYVMLYPEKAIDLVIVHELCHLRHMDHSEKFYKLLESFLPDHKERKKLLRGENMCSLEEIKKRYGDLFQ